MRRFLDTAERGGFKVCRIHVAQEGPEIYQLGGSNKSQEKQVVSSLHAAIQERISRIQAEIAPECVQAAGM